MKLQTFLSGALLLAALMPCVASAEEHDENLGATAPERACFYSRQAGNFEVLDERNFIVYAPTRSKAYHVQIALPSRELRSAQGLLFEGHSGRICGHAGETVGFGGRGARRRYPITDVWRLDEDQVDELTARYRAADGDAPVAPIEPDGAEIERELSDETEAQ